MAHILAILFSLASGGQPGVAQDKPTKWIHQSVHVLDGDTYKVKGQEWSTPGCLVTMIDKSGLDMWAFAEQADGWKISTHVQTKRGQKEIVTNWRTRVDSKGKTLRQQLDTDLFAANCLPDAKRLPGRVRKLFFGYGGIGK